MTRMRTIRRSLAVVATLTVAIAAPLIAQEMKLPDKVPGQPDPKVATKGSYRLDPAHSQVVFTVNHLGYTEYSGLFTNPTGTLKLDPRDPAASRVEVTFPIAGVKTTGAELDTELAGETFFDAAKYPTASFVSTKVTATGSTAMIAGNLTIHGVTRPVVLKTRFIGAGPEFWGAKKMAIGFAATTTINRSDFGMGMGLPMVADRVDLAINAGFEAE